MIVWDLAGVVAAFDPDARLRALADATGLDPERIDLAVWQSGLAAAADTGQLGKQRTWTETLRSLQNRLSRAELRQCWSLAFVPDPAVLAIVAQLTTASVMLTDNGAILEECLRHELRPVADSFSRTLLSWRLGATKSETVCFERAAQVLGQRPHDLTLIDDNSANVSAARAAGWQAIHYRGVASLTITDH